MKTNKKHLKIERDKQIIRNDRNIKNMEEYMDTVSSFDELTQYLKEHCFVYCVNSTKDTLTIKFMPYISGENIYFYFSKEYNIKEIINKMIFNNFK